MPMPWKYLRISRRLPCDKSISAVYLLMMAAVRFGPLLYFFGIKNAAAILQRQNKLVTPNPEQNCCW